jgi:hypothetical protein
MTEVYAWKKEQTELRFQFYLPKFTELIREVIDDLLFVKRSDSLTNEFIAKMVRRESFHMMQFCHFRGAGKYVLGGPDLNVVKFESGSQEYWHVNHFEARIRCLLSDVMMDRSMSKYMPTVEERRAFNSRLWCKAFENATFRSQGEAAKQKSVE